MKRPVTDEALLEDLFKPRSRRIPIPNPALTRYLEELDARRRDLGESTQRFARVNDSLEQSIRGVK